MATEGVVFLIRQSVARFYWEHDRNCATTTLCVLSELFDIQLSEQTLDSAVAMHGAGKYGAQCGLVEGAIMFIGVFGRHSKIEDACTIDACREFAQNFENRFGSLLCRVLRSEGFRSDNPPHLCERITCDAIEFAARHIAKFLKEDGKEFIASTLTANNYPRSGA